MTEFPIGGDIHATRIWLDKKGFVGFFQGLNADTLMGISDESIKLKFPETENGKNQAEILCGFLNSARQSISTYFLHSFQTILFFLCFRRILLENLYLNFLSLFKFNLIYYNILIPYIF